MITVYCDGSGTTGGPAGIGYVAILGGEIFKEGSLPLANATNQQAEILAAAYALHELIEDAYDLEDHHDVIVVSDSEYLVKGWNEYLPEWKARGWRKKSGGVPANTAHWRRLERAAAHHRTVLFQWTRSHVGTHGNERADLLAGQAREEAKRIYA